MKIKQKSLFFYATKQAFVGLLTLCLFISPAHAAISEHNGQAYLLAATEDRGMDYIDRMIFFGESTTAHLKARGVLSGGTATQQVWQDESGTRTLTSKITSEPLIYPPTGEYLTVAEACRRTRPEYLVLSFGLNGIWGFVNDPERYVFCYGKLIDAVREASPDTAILLQTVYPVRENTVFSTDAVTLNRHIEEINRLLPLVCAAHENVSIVDTASVLRDTNGALAAEYATEDGIHLTAAAYQSILYYLRTHAKR